MTPTEQVRAKCNEVIEAAARIYQVDLKKVVVSFDLKGRVAGWAQCKRGVYKVKFNHDMITRGDAEVLRDMVEDTVPHEYAHIVCYMRRELGSNHDAGWQRVCLALGGTAKRTHSNEVVFGKGTTYEYTSDRGHKLRLGDRHHRRIQAGETLRFMRGKGNVTMACAYSIVGQNGRSFAAPVVRQAVNHPDQIEMARRAAMVEELRARQRIVAPTAPRVQAPAPGESKAATSRRIMLAGYRGNQSYEAIITAMMAACGYDRQLARGTFKANAPKVGIPSTFY